MLKRLIVAAAALVLILQLAVCQVIVVNPTVAADFGENILVTSGQGTWTYEFELTPASSPTSDDAEWLRVDFVNANMDFNFTFNHLGSDNPNPSTLAPRARPVKFMTLQLSNDKVSEETGDFELDVGIVLRWRFRMSSLPSSVQMSSLLFTVFREFRYFAFEVNTELDASTYTIAQSFERSDLMLGLNEIGIFGGDVVQVPDNDDPRYRKFGTQYTTGANVDNTKYTYQLSGRQFLDFEVITPSYAMSHRTNRSSMNPTTSSLPNSLTGLHFFTLDITSSVPIGPTGLRYGAVLRYRFPYGLSTGVNATSLQFLYHDGTQWKSFKQASDRFEEYLSQATNELEFTKLQMNYVLAAKVNSDYDPEESSTEQPDNSDDDNNNNQSNSQGNNNDNSDEEPRDSISASAATIATLAVTTLALLVACF